MLGNPDLLRSTEADGIDGTVLKIMIDDGMAPRCSTSMDRSEQADEGLI